MQKQIFRFLLLSMAGILVGYASYFMVLQQISLRSEVRFAIILLIVLIVGICLVLFARNLEIDRKLFSATLALFFLSNLIVSVWVDLRDLPYTIRLLPTRQYILQPATDHANVQIKQYGTALNDDLGFDQFESLKGWEVNKRGILTQISGKDEPLVWTGKPGEYIYFEFIRCEDCGQIIVKDQDGKEFLVSLNHDLDTAALTSTFHADQLAFHRLLNFLSLQAALLTTSLLIVFWLSILLKKVRLAQPRKPVKLSANFVKRIPVIFLVAFPLVLYSFKIEPVIFNDDWCQLILPMHEDTLRFFDLSSRRPMHLSLGWIFYQVFSLPDTVIAMQVAHLFILIFTGVASYTLLLEIIPNRTWVALLGASLWLIFPSDYTHFYLSVLGIRLAYFLTILCLYLFIKYVKTGKLGLVWAGAGLAILSLLMYEGQLGILIVWPLVILWLFSKDENQARIPGFLVYWSSVMVFVVWRILIQPGFYQDSKLEYLSLNFWEILDSYLAGTRTILGGFQLPIKDASWISSENLVILFLVGILLLGLYLIARISVQEDREKEGGKFDQGYSLKLIAGGFVLWAAGYMPIILNYPPNIWGHLSRVNIFTILGVVLMLPNLLELLFVGVSRNSFQAFNLATLVTVALIFFGSMVQIQVQESYTQSWQESKSFYAALFETAPDLAPNTRVLVNISGDSEILNSRRSLFSSVWEPVCAFRVFYNDPTLFVNYVYQDRFVSEFPDIAVLGGDMSANQPPVFKSPAIVLGLNYDQATHSLTVLDSVDEYVQGSSEDLYQPELRIQTLTGIISSRELVE